ncbi:hypothetical protein AHAS_Ahas11G0029300 [Arachis hypogaea]
MVDSDSHEIKDIVVDETKILWIVNSEHKRVDEAQWVYVEVGKELCLCNKDSPYVGSINVTTCNKLNTYAPC